MPNSVRSYPDKPPFVLVASLNPEILPFLGTVPLLRISTSVALPAHRPFPSLLTTRRTSTMVEAGGPSGTCIPWHHSQGSPISRGLASESGVVGGPSLRLGSCSTSGHSPSPRAGLKRASRQPCCSGADSWIPQSRGGL